jgi:hypothetical protein
MIARNFRPGGGNRNGLADKVKNRRAARAATVCMYSLARIGEDDFYYVPFVGTNNQSQSLAVAAK